MAWITFLSLAAPLLGILPWLVDDSLVRRVGQLLVCSVRGGIRRSDQAHSWPPRGRRIAESSRSRSMTDAADVPAS